MINARQSDTELPPQELNARAYEGFKQRVLGMCDDQNEAPALIEYRQLRPGCFGGVKTIPVVKKYSPIVTKGVLVDNFCLIPFGYSA
jgi:hypothetical protein